MYFLPQAPWRPPGKWQIPDVFITDPLPYPALVASTVTQRRKSYSTPDQTNKAMRSGPTKNFCLHKVRTKSMPSLNRDTRSL